ncbi:hypothetical protein [Cupriavidus sp. BIC8F]|uniref:hypothetical protein n=1 Tax=Cupriavidus sp. BIC8F TaxID=3079014 RepID=UPI002915ECB4|nr:hypothetical protein [Cupriavidus sp. BIC8F]
MQGTIKSAFPTAPMIVVALVALLGGAQGVGTPASAAQRPAAAEKSPPGDIPDSQVFITYASPLGFALKVPEGWARTERQDGARFADKYNAIDIAVATRPTVPTAASVAEHEAVELARLGRAVNVQAIRNVTLQAGPAILIVYTSNSEPNPVTNKPLRVESRRYLIQRHGKLVTLDFSAPLGADNADQWKLMSNSFQWR